MAFCSNCGGKIEEGSKFCVKCGTQVNSELDTTVTTPNVTLVQEDNTGTETKKPVAGKTKSIKMGGLFGTIILALAWVFISLFILEEKLGSTVSEVVFWIGLFLILLLGGLWIPVRKGKQ